MKKTITLLLLIFNSLAYTQILVPYKDTSLTVEKRVEDLLKRMTEEEKFWQCFMLSESWNLPKDRYISGVFGFEGGETEVEAGAHAQLINISGKGMAKTIAERINSAQRFFIENSRLGIPMIPFGEALHGLIREGATSFPQAIALAATFDTVLMGNISRAIAQEARGCGIRMVLSPVVNISNDPRWGRTEETYGEDPCLSSAMGIAFVSGFERAGIISCPKHFVANYGDGGRDSYPVHHDERVLDEIYFPPFKACIQQGGSRSVMASYNSLSGVPCTANSWLLNKILKHDWKFEGIVISDAGATGGTNCLHMTAKDYPASSLEAMNNGLDVIFQTQYDHYKLFIPPFLDGSIRKTAIDSAVSRILKLKFQLGLFDKPYVDIARSKNTYGDTSHLALALQAARESIVLLKNDKNTLPLSSSLKNIAVIGTDAMEARLGGYSGEGYAKVSILEGIRRKVGGQMSDGRRQMSDGRRQMSDGRRQMSDVGGQIRYSPGCGRNSTDKVIVPADVFYTYKNGVKVQGLTAQYFNNTDLAGEVTLTRIDKNIDFRWTLYAPDPSINFDWFSVRWTGILLPPSSGKCRIGINGNDGYRLYINDTLIIDNWQKTSYNSRLSEYFFSKEKEYTIKLEFHETSGSVRFQLVWDLGVKDSLVEKMEKALNIAKQSDVIVYVGGIEEGEGLDRANLSLPGSQEDLIVKLAELGKPLVIILTGGSAITMNRWLDKVPAVLDVWYPGEQGGNAVADVLFGDYNPSGRLPITFPKTEGQLPLYYYHKPTGRNDDYEDLTGEALFPFGYGLSYTQFTYSNLIINNLKIKPGEKTKISFCIKNKGKLAGDEVPQLYIKDLYASVARPVKELKAFQRVHLLPGEEKIVTFTLTPEMLTMLNIRLEPTIEPGEFRILIGSSSKEIRLRGTLNVVP